ncbi:MAG: AAA family ATPase [Desulfovibrionaceae bacterium]|nr:AAA family ATPase [Desulfovibrionaceae bacterium]
MSRIITPGTQSFVKLRQNNYFYVDKTKFIKEWWNGGIDVTLITRPRRFGKTLMLDTVRTFFSPRFADRSDLFEGLEIWDDEQFRNLQGKIPVIFVSFANIKEKNYAAAVEQIKKCLNDLYDDFSRQFDMNLFSEREKKQFDSVQDDMSDTTAKTSLNYLCKHFVSQGYAKPIILLDEYDTPLHEAWSNGYCDELVDFLHGFFNSTFKTNHNIERALITGITRVAKESIFYDLNNLEVVSTTSDLYTDCFGFTEEEVFAAMDEYGLTNKSEVKQWYDGFIFGTQQKIYNPWSIIGYLSKKRIAPYWGNSSSNSLIGTLICSGDDTIKEETEKLLKGESIITKLDEQIVFSELYTKEGAIWSFFMASGYVKPLYFNLATKIYEITVTNLESKMILEDQISTWFYEARTAKNKFIISLLKNDLDAMNIWMTNITKSVFRYFDTANPGKSKQEIRPETFYHAFVLGLIIDLKQYEISSNGDSGYGRYDVMLMPKKQSDHAIVIEFKIHRSKTEKDLYKTCDNALKQIYENEYITKFKENNITLENIYVYGFAFKGKKVHIKGGAYAKIDWQSLLQQK